MKFSIPKIVRPIALTDYAPELVKPGTADPITIWVWVNPSVALIDEYKSAYTLSKSLAERLEKAKDGDEIRATALEMSANGQRFAAWYAEIWSQGKDPDTHWTAETVLGMSANETDPGLHTWLSGRTWEMIQEHREGRQKK